MKKRLMSLTPVRTQRTRRLRANCQGLELQRVNNEVVVVRQRLTMTSFLALTKHCTLRKNELVYLLRSSSISANVWMTGTL
mmetsp:Transcript_92959/g.259797  ORF Transcript_92959/g.259797 Transcript_92959/m.259797 type:complete len:81 (+) Transcript_92959:489-731(+)